MRLRRLWENIVGRSFSFWEYFYPKLKAKFPVQFKSVSIEDFYKFINFVQPSLIRMDADELTYNLHIMIRFDLECDLLENKLKVKDLPEAWDARYQADLGVKPPNLQTGVLQDSHWFDGLIGGKFQSYTIGNILSAQFYSAAKRAVPDLEYKISKGNFLPLSEWLKNNIHHYGRQLEAPDLILKASGKELNPNDYIEYLKLKYSHKN